MKHFLIIALSLCCFYKNTSAQTVTASAKKTGDNLIQLSGVIVDGDSLVGVPFVSIFAKGRAKAISDIYGFFTLVVEPGDDVQFLSVSHKKANYKLEDTLSLRHYFIIQKLIKDTVQLPSVTVYPWPSREEFKQAFLHLNLSETDYERAAKNLDRTTQSYDERNMQMDAQANYSYAMNQYIRKVNNGGQAPVNNLLNPIAWAKFIDALSKGKFKRQPSKKK